MVELRGLSRCNFLGRLTIINTIINTDVRADRGGLRPTGSLNFNPSMSVVTLLKIA
jgi:hypothetical protein